MKKLILIYACSLIMNFSSCFSQSLGNNNTKEFESGTKYVYGYSNDFKELDLGITFKKVINLNDTSYYIKFQLHAPSSEFRKDIQIIKTRSITFLSASNKKIDLILTDLVPSIASKVDTYNDFVLSNLDSYYSTNLILKVTKESLIEIGSEPFYQIILPYYNSTNKVEENAIFVRPTLLTRRNFTQKNIKYILDI